jgi:hypothetical protein
MNIRHRLDRLESVVPAAPAFVDEQMLDEMSDYELAVIIAAGTELTPEEVLALDDDALLAIANGGAAGAGGDQ